MLLDVSQFSKPNATHCSIFPLEILQLKMIKEYFNEIETSYLGNKHFRDLHKVQIKTLIRLEVNLQVLF